MSVTHSNNSINISVFFKSNLRVYSILEYRYMKQLVTKAVIRMSFTQWFVLKHLFLPAASPRTTTLFSRTSPDCGSKVSWTTRTRTARSSPTLHMLASTPTHTYTDARTHTQTHTLLHSSCYIPQGRGCEGMFGRRSRRGSVVFFLSCFSHSSRRHFSPPSSPSVFSVSLFAEG